MSADYSVLDTSASYMMKWRFDANKAGTLPGWQRSDDGDIIYVARRHELCRHAGHH